MNTWNCKILGALLLILFSAPASAADCGLVSNSAARLPTNGKLWLLGQRYIYEYGGGLSTSMIATNPAYKFSQSNEQLVSAWRSSANRTLLITRQKRGFGAYLWDSSAATPIMTHLMSHTLSTTENKKTIISPLVDVYVDTTHIYLLTNFHVLVLSTNALLNGSYSATTEKIPGCPTLSDSCWRGTGFLPLLEGLAVARMRTSSGALVNLDLIRPYGASPVIWSTAVGLTLPRATYVNLLRPQTEQNQDSLTPLAVSTNASTHLLAARLPEQKMFNLPDYPIAVALLPSPNFSQANGAISFAEQGTFLFRNGAMICRAFEPATSLVIKPGALTTEITGINAEGTLMTVEVRN